MALVRSRRHEVYKAKWSHSCQPRWLPVIQDTLLQQGNYLSQSRHIWQGDTPKISSQVIRTAICRAGLPIDRLLGKFHTCHQGCQAEQPSTIHRLLGKFHSCQQGCKDTYQKTQKGGVLHFQGITEAGSRPLLRQRSSTPQSAAPCHADLPRHQPPEALPCWIADFVHPAAHLAPEILPCKTLTTPLPTVLFPGPAD